MARAFAANLANRPTVGRFWDDGETASVDLATAVDTPTPGFSTCSTVSLHGAVNMVGGRDVRVELVGVAGAEYETFPNVVATTAFFVIKNGWAAHPGAVFPNVLGGYGLPSALAHVVLTPPFAWEGLSDAALIGGVDVQWLGVVPISEGEARIIAAEGFDAFETLFQDADYFDLERPPLA